MERKLNRNVHRREAFTIMELMTVIVIIGILAVMLMSTVAGLRDKAERGRCVNNLQGLYAAGVSYVTDNGSWPQIPMTDVGDPAFAKAWMDAFKPYKIAPVNWHCATVRKSLGLSMDSSDLSIDYIPTSFNSKPSSPWMYSTHPWFMERAGVHGGGNLFIFANGQIHSLSDYSKK